MVRPARTARTSAIVGGVTAAAVAVSTAALVGLSGPAGAATLPAAIVPGTGNIVDVVSVDLPVSGCPANTTSFAAVLLGAGFPAAGQAIKGSTLKGEISADGVYRLGFSFRDTAQAAGATLTAGSTYTVKTFCQDDFSNRSGDDYDAQFRVDSTGQTGTYTAVGGTTATPSASATATARPTTSVSPSASASPSSVPTTPPVTTTPPTTAPTTPPTTAPAGGFTLRISPRTIVVRPGVAVTLSTRLVRANGTGVGAARVGIYTREAGKTSFVLSRRTVTNGAGLSTGTFRPVRDFRWFTNYDLNARTNGARSASGLVQVR